MMDLNNGKTAVLLITMCILAAIAGAAASQFLLDDDNSDNPVKEELRIPVSLVNDDVGIIIKDLESSDPDNVVVVEEGFILKGSAVSEFDEFYFTDRVRFNEIQVAAPVGIEYIVSDGNIKYSQDLTKYYLSDDTITEKLFIPESFLNENISSILVELNSTYGDAIDTSGDPIMISGRMTINDFNKVYFSTGSNFEWDQDDDGAEETITLNVYEDETLLYSEDYTYFYNRNSLIEVDVFEGGKFVVLSYDELEKLIEGDEETIEHYSSVLENMNNFSVTTTGSIIEIGTTADLGWV
ncbi:hypothetical protein [Methanococcoides methylutens]|uniref:Uncharacterized protein n=1 Tax=Methanococcoides methylutens MM1 TaxID=1434104 RepID=A0A0E3SRI0_METMT|nr:hypothetical protein [Methanococcoides methylutens]AKB84918.1 hypothetical protein MCMEM_0865 [Methanococcoides methylutens MM1]